MVITSVTKEGGYLIIVENGETFRRSIVYEDTVVSGSPTGYQKVGVIYVNHSEGKLVVTYNGNSIELDSSATGDLTGPEIVTLLEALGVGSRLSHTKLDDVGASDHHAKYTNTEAVTAAKADGDISDAITKKHTQNTDTDLSPAHKDADTGVHGVGVSTVESVSGSQGKVDDHGAVVDAHHQKYTDGEAVVAAKTVKLDDFTVPDDNTDLDGTTAKHGLYPKTAAVKLATIATNANAYVHPNHSGEVTSVADGAQTITNKAVTYAKIQDVSALDRVLGRTSGSGVIEEIACTTAGRALLSAVSAPAQKLILSLDNVENTKHSTDAHTMSIDGRDVSADGAKLDTLDARYKVSLIEPALWQLTNQSDTAFTSKDADDIATAPSNAVGVIFLAGVRDDGALGVRCYMSFRKDNGDTVTQKSDCPVGDARWMSTMIMCRLGAGNTFEYEIVASGAGTFDTYVELIGWVIE